MFQRLKGVIDARIAEEQARQREASRSQAPQLQSQSLRHSRTESGSNLPPQRGPDPKEFDPELAAAEDEDPSTGSEADLGSTCEGLGGNESSAQTKSVDTKQSPTKRAELPTDVRVKLRRLNKMENKYRELLSAYRISHARVVSIEPFEAALRENTPLTSIDDAGAFTEYVNQTNLKSNMVLSELKRVTTERDDYKQKLTQTESTTSEGQNQPAQPKEEQKVSTVGSEEFFSYEGEIPRLQSELEQRETEVSALRNEMKTLQDRIADAQASAQNATAKMEATNQELTTMRTEKAEQDNRIRSAENSLSDVVPTLQLGDKSFEHCVTSVLELKDSLTQKDEEIKQLREQMSAQPGGKAPEEQTRSEQRYGILQDILSMLKAQLKDAENTISKLRDQLAVQEKKGKVLDNLCAFLDLFLPDDSWKKAKELMLNGSDLTSTRRYIERLKLRLPIRPPIDPASRPRSASESSIVCRSPLSPSKKSGVKKKNKKKNREKNAAADHQVQAFAPATAAPRETSNATDSDHVSKLEHEVQTLTGQLNDKEEAVNRLHEKLKGEESLHEEIETLRDGLLHVGEEHVETKTKVKELATEKKELESKIADLEKAVADSRDKESRSQHLNETHTRLETELGESNTQVKHLQKDLDAAQKLAASRFKELNDQKEKWQKLQPELRSLRENSKQLRTTREELSSKIGELKRLDKRHQDVLSDIKNLQMRIGSQDMEMKSLNQRLMDETTARSRSDNAILVARSDMQYSEQQRQEAIESNEQTKQDLQKAREFLQNCHQKIAKMETELRTSSIEINNLKEELRVNNALHGSSTQLVNEMRDQTRELSVQLKEYREHSEGLEEEVNRTHRLLSERTHDTEVVRGLLSSVEMQTETKIRDLKERLNTTAEERDNAEDEVSNVRRKKAREIEELKTEIRDLEKTIRMNEEDKAEIELASKEWKKRRETAEAEAERANLELQDLQQAMAELRGALLENEKLVHRLEKDKNDLRRSLDDVTSRFNKLQTQPTKSIADEARARHSATPERSQSRQSVDIGQSGSSVSPVRTAAASSLPIDHVYLKNVLLQFMEQKDKNYQKQLIPVLSMLLKFDATDEQRWMSAISSK